MFGVNVTRLVIAGLLLLFRTAFYLTGLAAVHLTLAGFAAWRALSPGNNHPREASDEVYVGVVFLWSSGLGLILGLLSGSQGMFLIGVVLTLPLSGIVGWQAGVWRDNTVKTNRSHALVLGQRRGSTFLVELPFTVSAGQRVKQMWIIGPTGSGKTSLVKNLALQDISSRGGICVIDPKDNLIDSLLPLIPRSRWQDVILLDAADTEFPLGFNPLADVPAHRRTLATSELLAVFRRYFAASWGARLEHILNNVILALLEVPNATLLDIPKMLLDETFRQQAMRQVTNPGVQQFFANEFERLLKRRGDSLEPILNKVGPWLAYPEIRNIIGQPTSSFDLRQVMDRGQILLVRIPHGALGEEISSLLAGLITTKLQLAAHSRVDVPSAQRRFFALYADEFQLYASSTFIRMVTEARAFNLSLVCANQYPEQLGQDLRLALQKNVATAVTCLYESGRYRLAVRELENGEQSEPTILTPAPPPSAGDAETATQLRSLSRLRYGRPRQEVEREILKSYTTKPEEQQHSRPPKDAKPRTRRRDVDED